MFSARILRIDAPRLADEAARALREQVLGTLRRRGAVVGVSGGIDSSVVAALCARALGPERVLALSMPERDSSGDALRLGTLLAGQLGIRHVVGLDAAQVERVYRDIEAERRVSRCLHQPPLLVSESRGS